MTNKMTTKEKLEKEIERKIKQIGNQNIGDEKKLIELEWELAVLKAKLQQHNEDVKMFEEKFKNFQDTIKIYQNREKEILNITWKWFIKYKGTGLSSYKYEELKQKLKGDGK